MKIFFCLLFLFIYSSSKGQEKVPNAVTLLNAIEYGLKNNRAIINANRDVQKAYKDKWNTISLGLPQIISSVDYQNFIELPVSLVPAEFFGG